MTRTINVLIVDDHPMIIDILKMTLLQLAAAKKKLKFQIETACSCENAYLKMEKSKNIEPFDLILLDIGLPPSKKHRLFSGEDVGERARELFKNIKVVVFTSHFCNHKLFNIFKTINPEGFLVKSEINYEDMIKAIYDVICGITYYSKTILQLLRNHMSTDILLDRTDREILYYLSLGLRVKDLPSSVNLSLAGIERRKRHLYDVFNVKTRKKDNRELIQLAREKGFV